MHNVDVSIFFGIYHHVHTEIGDRWIPLLRNTYTWIPYFFLVFYLLYKKYAKNNFLKVIALFVLCVVLSDQLSAHLLKPIFQRPRPCHSYDIVTLVDCGSGYSFPSAHASNFFTLAFLLYFFLQESCLRYWGFIVAFSVAFAQIYVGVHYPFDILGGILVGCIIAFVAQSYSKKYFLKNMGQ